MLGNTLFVTGLLIAVGLGFVYFRDLGDVSQMVLRVKHINMVRFIRNEYRILAIWLSWRKMVLPGLINATIGGQDIVVAYAAEYESIGVCYNHSGTPVTSIDFYGRSGQDQLKRVETLKAGMFWHVWVEFFQHTDINRVGQPSDTNEKSI